MVQNGNTILALSQGANEFVEFTAKLGEMMSSQSLASLHRGDLEAVARFGEVVMFVIPSNASMSFLCTISRYVVMFLYRALK